MTAGRTRLLSTEDRLYRATGREKGRATKGILGAEAITSHSATPNPGRDRRAAPLARMDPTEADLRRMRLRRTGKGKGKAKVRVPARQRRQSVPRMSPPSHPHTPPHQQVQPVRPCRLNRPRALQERIPRPGSCAEACGSPAVMWRTMMPASSRIRGGRCGERDEGARCLWQGDGLSAVRVVRHCLPGRG